MTIQLCLVWFSQLWHHKGTRFLKKIQMKESDVCGDFGGPYCNSKAAF